MSEAVSPLIWTTSLGHALPRIFFFNNQETSCISCVKFCHAHAWKRWLKLQAGKVTLPLSATAGERAPRGEDTWMPACTHEHVLKAENEFAAVGYAIIGRVRGRWGGSAPAPAWKLGKPCPLPAPPAPAAGGRAGGVKAKGWQKVKWGGWGALLFASLPKDWGRRKESRRQAQPGFLDENVAFRKLGSKRFEITGRPSSSCPRALDRAHGRLRLQGI